MVCSLWSPHCRASSLGFLEREGANTGADALNIQITFPNFGPISCAFRACWSLGGAPREEGSVRYLFEDCTLDTDRRELRRGGDVRPVAAQVFDLLEYLIRNRARVVSKDDLVGAIWDGRIVSEAAITTRLN